jgi:hypothetical protein
MKDQPVAVRSAGAFSLLDRDPVRIRTVKEPLGQAHNRQVPEEEGLWLYQITRA